MTPGSAARECRHFIVKPNGTTHEARNCLRLSCPQCWKYTYTDDLQPFVPWTQQWTWVNEFLAGVVKAPIVEGVNGVIGEERRMTEEERVFGLNYSTFPTDRRHTSYQLALDQATPIKDCRK